MSLHTTIAGGAVTALLTGLGVTAVGAVTSAAAPAPAPPVPAAPAPAGPALDTAAETATDCVDVEGNPASCEEVERAGRERRHALLQTEPYRDKIAGDVWLFRPGR